MLHVHADFPHPGSIAIAIDTGERVRINQRNADGTFSIIASRVRTIAADQLVAPGVRLRETSSQRTHRIEGNAKPPADAEWRRLARFSVEGNAPLPDSLSFEAFSHQRVGDHFQMVCHGDEVRKPEPHGDPQVSGSVLDCQAQHGFAVDDGRADVDISLGSHLDRAHQAPSPKRDRLAAALRPVTDEMDQAVRDMLETASELQRLTRIMAGLTVGTPAEREAVDYQQELIGRIRARANSAQLHYADLIAACDARIAADRRAREVA